jgi:hypothetical protein
VRLAACIRKVMNVYKTVVGKPEVKRLFSRYRRRCKDKIKTDLEILGVRL